eukprot:Nitzschia sp. Nitz4//scaffold296_size27349//23702//24739//NITZ4_008201-RA/size27349-processed-gene-0.25-mRNA-1//-1//CDS//3329546276//6800//frame0
MLAFGCTLSWTLVDMQPNREDDSDRSNQKLVGDGSNFPWNTTTTAATRRTRTADEVDVGNPMDPEPLSSIIPDMATRGNFHAASVPMQQHNHYGNMSASTSMDNIDTLLSQTHHILHGSSSSPPPSPSAAPLVPQHLLNNVQPPDKNADSFLNSSNSSIDRSNRSATSTKSEQGSIRPAATGGAEVPLPSYFRPGPYSVIIGRGKESKGVVGNRRLRIIASTFLDRYANAPNKSSKSGIVATIVAVIREACPLGAFVRLGKDGKWYEVKDAVASEKVGYTLRELLGDQYKSSSRSKVRRRQGQLDGVSSCSSSAGSDDEEEDADDTASSRRGDSARRKNYKKGET